MKRRVPIAKRTRVEGGSDGEGSKKLKKSVVPASAPGKETKQKKKAHYGGRGKRERDLKRSNEQGEVREDAETTSVKISAFHTLLKKKANNPENAERYDKQIEELGGLQEYQRISLSGEIVSSFESSDWVAAELKKRITANSKLRVLDVGAIRKRYETNDKRIGRGISLDVTSIDLASEDPQVERVDFFDFVKRPNTKGQFDVVVLSLVLNFLPTPLDRGQMLYKAARLLKQGGLLFLVLPHAAIANSRYMKFSVLERILSRVGIPIADSGHSHHVSDKLFFAVCERGEEVMGVNGFEKKAMYKRTLCRGGASRNNFCILLPRKLEEETAKQGAKKKAKPAEASGEAVLRAPVKAKPRTSNQRKRDRARRWKEAQKAQEAKEKGAVGESNVAVETASTTTPAVVDFSKPAEKKPKKQQQQQQQSEGKVVNVKSIEKQAEKQKQDLKRMLKKAEMKKKISK